MLAAGTRLGPYRIVDLLGVGGMGEVYRAEDSRLGRDVAIKVLPPHLAGNAAALERFRREARAVASLSHPNIVAIFDFGSEDGIDYAVTELLEGETLRSRLQRGPLPPDEALDMLRAIAEGVAAAHARGIIHRDLKPENVFITTSGRVKVLDFGLARSTTIETTGEFSKTAVLPTEPGMVIGTVGYLAPEQFEGRPLTPATDVFALGCLLYEMIQGELPFSGISAAHAMASLLRDEPAPLAIDGIDALVQKCLAKQPSQRLRDAGELVTELSRVEPRGSTRRVSFDGRRWSRAIAIAALIAVIVAAALFVRSARMRQIDHGYDLRVADIRADSDTRRLIELALRADAEGNRAKAMELLEEANRRSSATPLPAAFLSSFTDAAGDQRAATKWAAEAAKRLRDDAPAYESLLVRYFIVPSAESERELALAKSALDVRPGAWRLRLAAAHIHLSRRDRAAALRELQRIDVSKPDDRRLMLVLADRAALGDVEGAARDLARSRLRRRPPIFHYTEGRIAWSRGDVAGARVLFDKAADAAAAANLAPVEIEARLLAGLALLRLNDAAAAQHAFGTAGARAHHLRIGTRHFDAVALAAYAAARLGDTEERDRKLANARELALDLEDDASLRLLAMRLGSQLWRTWPPLHLPNDPHYGGASLLVNARAKLVDGDAAGARRLLQTARSEGIDATGYREEAELLAAELGLPSRLLPADPPYPIMVRYLAIFDLERRHFSMRTGMGVER